MKVSEDLPALVIGALPKINSDALKASDDPGHKPRILLLYGSLRAQSYSRRAAEESARILRHLGCETRFFDPTGLPLPDSVDPDHPKVAELRALAVWAEGMVWSSPERHGAMTAIMKAQIDWLPLSLQGGIRPTQGKTLAVLQVSGGSQSFNAVNQMRILGRWMRMITIPNQSSIPKAWLEFDGKGRLPKGPFYARVVDVMEELVKFTWLVRGRSDYLVDRYSERVESVEEVHNRVSLKDT
jgi:arsenic resistance protein ArsH